MFQCLISHFLEVCLHYLHHDYKSQSSTAIAAVMYINLRPLQYNCRGPILNTSFPFCHNIKVINITATTNAI